MRLLRIMLTFLKSRLVSMELSYVAICTLQYFSLPMIYAFQSSQVAIGFMTGALKIPIYRCLNVH